MHCSIDVNMFLFLIKCVLWFQYGIIVMLIFLLKIVVVVLFFVIRTQVSIQCLSMYVSMLNETLEVMSRITIVHPMILLICIQRYLYINHSDFFLSVLDTFDISQSWKTYANSVMENIRYDGSAHLKSHVI